MEAVRGWVWIFSGIAQYIDLAKAKSVASVYILIITYYLKPIIV